MFFFKDFFIAHFDSDDYARLVVYVLVLYCISHLTHLAVIITILFTTCSFSSSTIHISLPQFLTCYNTGCV